MYMHVRTHKQQRTPLTRLFQRHKSFFFPIVCYPELTDRALATAAGRKKREKDKRNSVNKDFYFNGNARTNNHSADPYLVEYYFQYLDTYNSIFIEQNWYI